MFNLFEGIDESKFTWESVGDIVDGRRNLGQEMPVYVYRLFQFTIKDIMTRKLGKEETTQIFREAGHLSGVEFANHMLDLTLEFDDFLATLQKSLEDSKMGILRVEDYNEVSGAAILTVAEDLDCSGLPVTGETVCNYDEGFLSGVLSTYLKKEYVVTEIDCWATGSRVCRFEAHVKEV